MPKNKKPNPIIREMMDTVLQLRARDATPDEAKDAARSLYPGNNGTDGPHRSRLMRLYYAPAASIRAAETCLNQGGNVNEVMSLVPTVSNRGAPAGNTNAHGKRTQSIVTRIEKLWFEATATERKLFIQRNISK